MGFSGHLVFARSERPLLEAPLFKGTGQGPSGDVHEWRPRPGGWQTLQLKQGIWEDEHLSVLVEWTGAPACVADVSDSEVALVTGLDTQGRRWQAWLHLDIAAALLVEEPEDMDDTSLWITTPEFEENLRQQLRGARCGDTDRRRRRSHVGIGSRCPGPGTAAPDRGTAARAGNLCGRAVRHTAGRAWLP